jgi:hypothetical protein
LIITLGAMAGHHHPKSDVVIKIAPMFPALPNLPNMQLISNAYILLSSNVRDSRYFSICNAKLE